MSCTTEKFTQISGTIENGANLNVFLEKVVLSTQNANEKLLSGKIDDQGKFEMKLPDQLGAGIYRLAIGGQGIELIFNGDETDVKVAADLKTIRQAAFTVEGSPLTEEFLQVIKGYVSKKIDISQLRKLATEESSPLVGFMIASRMFTFKPDFAEVHESVLNRLKSETPDVDFIPTYQDFVGRLKQDRARKMASQKIKVGMDAPDIVMKDTKGKTRKLSDLKGKLVLIDFWASWCGPCRRENPKVVKVYNQYKDQGFDVFSVSLDGIKDAKRNQLKSKPSQLKMNLDRSKEKWVQAIKKDKLVWPNHVSDLKSWSSAAAAQYGVSTIPKTFLVGRDGKIVVVDPRVDLEEQVKKHI